MSIKKKSLLVVGAAVLVLGSLAFSQENAAAGHQEAAAVEEEVAEAVEEEEEALEEAAAAAQEAPAAVEAQPAAAPASEPAPVAVKEEPKKTGLTITPYGRAHYRFREQINSRSGKGWKGADTSNYSQTIANYTNRLAWQLGLKAAVNEQVSLQFQIGNDWGSPEDVNYALNNGVRSRFLSGVSLTKNNDGDINGAVLSGYQNLYIHIASARWNPGPLFIEVGVVPLVSNGTLDLLESSLSRGRYQETVFDWWSQYNNSMIGFKIGAPLVKGDVKVSAELFQTIIDNRAQSLPSNLANEPTANPPSVLFVLDVPIEAGAIKVTPEFTGVINRNYNTATEEADHEFIGGLSASCKVSDAISLSLTGGYGAFSNENSKVGSYSTNVRSGSIAADAAEAITPYKTSGMLIGAGTSIKAGPGNVQLNVNYNNTQDGQSDATIDNTKYDYINTDLRYTWRVNKNFSIMPRYRTDTILYPENNVNDTELRHRFELVFEGSF